MNWCIFYINLGFSLHLAFADDILQMTFCIVHIAYCILHIAYCILHFTNCMFQLQMGKAAFLKQLNTDLFVSVIAVQIGRSKLRCSK
jgi:tryptophan-rich sensory protein